MFVWNARNCGDWGFWCDQKDSQTPWPVGCETKAPANAPPIDNFPTYDEQPGPSADDPPSVWILRRDKLHQGSWLPCRSLLLRKILSGKTGILYPKSSIFSRFGAKCRLDNTIFIMYSNLDCLKPVGTCCRISGSTICCYSSPASQNINNLSFFALKREFLSFYP